jgi:rhamnosyl/mannosyltransferase
LAGRVHFAGNVSDEDLPRYYRLADVHVLPSTGRTEAFGLVVLEAAASGVPTIASALPGVRTVVRDGETGIHVVPADAGSLRGALTTLFDRPDLRRRLGRAARARAVADFAWDPLIDRLENTYLRCAAARGHAAAAPERRSGGSNVSQGA